jgi:hypothetical protein
MSCVRQVLLILTGTCVVASVAHTAQYELPASLIECLTQKDDALRLSCYDREVARLKREPVTAPPPAPANIDPQASFGYRGGAIPEEQERRKAEVAALPQLDSTIVAISKRPYGELVLTLENQQVWVQKSPDSTRLKVGDRITIKRAMLGAFLLVGPTGRSTSVARLQ